MSAFTYPHIQRKAFIKGFRTEVQVRLPAKLSAYPAADAAFDAVAAGRNVVVMGPMQTGKKTFITRLLEGPLKGRRVAVTATRPRATAQLGGMLLASFLGIKPNAEVLSVETATASLARHVRAMRGPFGHVLPCLVSVDVLVISGIELMSPHALIALDVVARQERECPDKPFGGLQIVATADWWRAGATPSSPLVGNLFQLPQWPTFFDPKDQLLFLRFFAHDLARDPKASLRTIRAMLGTLRPSDIADLSRATRGSSSPLQADGAADAKSSGNATVLEICDDRTGRIHESPRFPKQPVAVTLPERLAIVRSTAFGQYLFSALQSVNHAAAAGLSAKLHLVGGERVALSYDLTIAGEKNPLPRGTMATVVGAAEHYVTLRLDGSTHTLSVPRMRILASVASVTSIECSLTQFPVFGLGHIYPFLITSETIPVPRGANWSVDARKLTSVHDLSNIMAVLPTNANVFSQLADYLKRDGFVYEPVKVYTERVLAAQDPKLAAAVGIDTSNSEERWCRNCKTHIPGPQFHEHWDKCVEAVRWCTDCSVTVPVAKWPAHCEKHTIVMCIDCGRALEWRYWDQHRKMCGMMLRELSPDNEHLPAATKLNTLEAPIDRGDLHTVKAISRSMLPRSHLQVESGPRVKG